MGPTTRDFGANDYSHPGTGYLGPVGGHLKYFAKNWAHFWHDNGVCSTLNVGYALEFTGTLQSYFTPHSTPIPVDKQQRLALEN